MTNLNKLPNKQNSLLKMKILEALQQNAKQNTVLGIGIVHAICEKIPAPEIFSFIKECAKGNRQWVIDCITEPLLDEILNLPT